MTFLVEQKMPHGKTGSTILFIFDGDIEEYKQYAKNMGYEVRLFELKEVSTKA